MLKRKLFITLFILVITVFTACANQGNVQKQVQDFDNNVGQNNLGQQVLDEGQEQLDLDQERAPKSFGVQSARPQGPTTNKNNQLKQKTNNPKALANVQNRELTMQVNTSTVNIPAKTHNNLVYVPVKNVFNKLNYNVKESESGNSILAGFTDVIHQVSKNSNKAILDGKNITLPHQAVTLNDDTYVTVESLRILLGAGYDVQLTGNKLIIKNEIKEDFQFPGNEELGDVTTSKDAEAIPVISADKADRIIATAKKYIGTPYEFGASTDTTKVFDCSTFTKHVFETQGITLPRTSRTQAQIGRYVPVSQLKKGDLVFFNWPGRYTTNKVVGHVGIYIGDGNIIHTIPSKGVHIVNAKKSSYWSKNYLGARRVGE